MHLPANGLVGLQAMGENAIGLIQEFAKVLRDEPDKAAAQDPDDQGMVFFDVLGLFMVRHTSRACCICLCHWHNFTVYLLHALSTKGPYSIVPPVL